MSRKGAFLVAFFILSLASAFSLAGRAEPLAFSRPGPQPRAVVFAVFGPNAQGLSARIEPILILEGGQYKAPVAGDSDASEITRFSNQHYSKGKKYRVLFGGAEAGTLTVTKSSKDEECFRTGADVTLQSSARLNRNVMALATDSNTLGLAAGERSRRTPTPSEREQALELARSVFKQKGVAASLIPNMQVINLTAMDLNRDGKAELAGSFVVSKRTRGQERYALFLVGVSQGTGYRAAVSNYGKYTEKEIMSGASINIVNEGIYVERLVDHLDLNGDGTGELVTLTTGLEGVTYTIYRMQGGGLSQAYEFANYRCAF